MRLLLCGLMLVAAPVWAAKSVLPPDVRELEAKVNAAEAGIRTVRSELAASGRKYAVMDTRLRRATTTLLRVRQYPEGFWLTKAMVENKPGVMDVAAMAAKQSVNDVRMVDARVKALRELYGEANAKVDAWRGVQVAFASAGQRLSAQQKQALRESSIEAEELAARLAAVKTAEADVAPLEDENVAAVEASGGPVGLPLDGEVVQRFRQAKGATREGMVIGGKQGDSVRSVVPGEVLYSGPFRQFGGVVIVKAVGGEDVVYGGLGSLHVVTGGRVLAGDVLGEVGEDGKLYWEVRKRGRTINPLALR